MVLVEKGECFLRLYPVLQSSKDEKLIFNELFKKSSDFLNVLYEHQSNIVALRSIIDWQTLLSFTNSELLNRVVCYKADVMALVPKIIDFKSLLPIIIETQPRMIIHAKTIANLVPRLFSWNELRNMNSQKFDQLMESVSKINDLKSIGVDKFMILNLEMRLKILNAVPQWSEFTHEWESQYPWTVLIKLGFLELSFELQNEYLDHASSIVILQKKYKIKSLECLSSFTEEQRAGLLFEPTSIESQAMMESLSQSQAIKLSITEV